VPTVNFLGALDDGTGKYTRGFDFDDRHPNAAGHHELMYTFVPTLFDALEMGKPIPAAPIPAGFARVTEGLAPFTFTPLETMHPFAMSFVVRAQGDGTVAAVSGSTLMGKSEVKNSPRGNATFESMSLSGDRPFTEAIGVQNGKWIYKSARGDIVRSEVTADTEWHHIVLSHYTARGETLFFVDGKLTGKAAERLQPTRFVLGGPGAPGNAPAPKQADYKDVLVFRSALNADEAAALHEGKLLQASLEIYAPLNDSQFRPDSVIENRAQSLTAFKVGSGRIVHVIVESTTVRGSK